VHSCINKRVCVCACVRACVRACTHTKTFSNFFHKLMCKTKSVLLISQVNVQDEIGRRALPLGLTAALRPRRSREDEIGRRAFPLGLTAALRPRRSRETCARPVRPSHRARTPMSDRRPHFTPKFFFSSLFSLFVHACMH